jgi:hypothetical protein
LSGEGIASEPRHVPSGSAKGSSFLAAAPSSDADDVFSCPLKAAVLELVRAELLTYKSADLYR